MILNVLFIYKILLRDNRNVGPSIQKIFFLFSEDILKRADAIWPSPDGNKLIYATFNDTEVQQVRWKVYEDTSDGNLDPYPKEKTMYYPKVSIE